MSCHDHELQQFLIRNFSLSSKMGCGGSKAVRTRTAPVPIALDQGQATTIITSSKEETSPLNHREQPDGKTTVDQTASEGHQETQKPDNEEPVTQKQISLVQETWGLVNGDLEKVGVDFYIR